MPSKRGKENLLSDMALYLARRCSRQSPAEVGQHFGLPKERTVSSAVEQIAARTVQAQTIYDQLHELIAKINKSQKKA